MAKIIIKNARLSFPSLWSTNVYNGVDQGNYEASLLIPKESEQGKAITKAVKDAAEEKFGKPLPKKIGYPLTDGDEKEYDGYADHWVLKAKTKKRPVVIDQHKTPVTEDDGVIYAGCYVNASVEIGAYENQYGKRVGCILNGVQFAKAGEAFGGNGGNVMNDFDEIESDESEEESPFA